MPSLEDQQLEAVRRHGFAVAYRMLGSVGEAEDLVQEALLRLTRLETAPDEPAAWITTVVTRLCIDHLRLARVQRETYVGPWLPEPLLADTGALPAERAEMADSLSQAFLVLLEQLTPLERAAFLLREVFGYDYADIATIVDRSQQNCRQLVTRAKKHLESRRPRFDPDEELRDELLQRFLAAAEGGDLAALESLLAEDAVLYGDGGGKVRAALEPVVGGVDIARFILEITTKRRKIGEFGSELIRVNGQPGRVLRTPDAEIWDVMSVDIVEGRIQTIRIVRNPDKLAHL
jgi:RNA polymerase sigma-70 factor, ECF subfamily